MDLGERYGLRMATVMNWAFNTTARDDVDEYSPPWVDFADFFASRRNSNDPYLLLRDAQSRNLDTWTTGQWQVAVYRVADRLVEHGVKPGDNVVTLAGNSAEALALAFATWLIGACLVPLETDMPEDRRKQILTELGVDLVFVGPKQEMTTLATRHPTISAVDVSDLILPRAGDEGDRNGTPEVGTLEVAALRVYTSGTTGQPKSILLTMRNILLNCESMRRGFGWTADTRVMTVLPIHHVNGLLINSFLPWFVGGSTVLNEKFSGSTFWASADEARATTISLVPTILEVLLAQDDGPMPTSIMRQVISGSGPLRPETAAEFERRFGIAVRQIYGLSENTAVLTVTPDRGTQPLPDDFRGSVGSVVPHVSIEVLDPQGQPCAEGQVGELVARGGLLMAGYCDNEPANIAAFHGGWFHSGDLGHWRQGDDGNRWYFVDGRMKDVIIRGGETIIPQAIDVVVERHPRVRRAAAIAFPNRWYGEEIAVYIVPQGDIDGSELLEWCAEQLGHQSAPKVVVFGEDFPLTLLGKVRRNELAARAAEELAAHWDTSFRPIRKRSN